MHGMCSKSGKKIKISKFIVSRFTFQDVIFKTKIIYIFVISTLSTVIWSQIYLGFHYIFLEISRKILGICVTQEMETLSMGQWSVVRQILMGHF